MSNAVDVVVVGGGLAGSALALKLDAAGFSVAVVERGGLFTDFPSHECRQVGDFDVRVSALSPNSLNFIDTLLAGELGSLRQQAYQSMKVWDGEGTGCVRFDSRDLGVSSLGSIIENSALLSALRKAISATHIRFLGGVTLEAIQNTSNTVTAVLSDASEIQAAVLVGADGALSGVRAHMGVDVREWSYEQSAIVATIELKEAHRDCARQWFLRTGPLALPSSTGHFCSIVWSVHTEEAEALMALNDAEFATRLSAASELGAGAILAVSRRASVPLRQRHVVEYARDRCVLVADAAHTIHPLAGQGINIGFADVDVLAEELIRAKVRGADIGSNLVLNRYQRRRKTDNLAVMAAMEGFVRLFDRQELGARLLRNVGMTWFDSLAGLKKRIAAVAMGIS
jgi:2-octaprenylphenol hydroxylase